MTAWLQAMRGSVRRHGGALAWSGASQAISSLTTFATTLYLLRAVDKQQFGVYGFALALTLLLAGPLGDFVALQLVVNLPDQPKPRRGIYAAHHAAAIGLIGGAIVAAAAAFSVLARASWPAAAALALPMAGAAALYCGRDLLVRVAYCERRERTAASSSLAALATIAVTFAALAGFGVPLDAATGIGVYALGQLAGLSWAAAALRLPLGEVHCRGLGQAFADVWRGGRWSICTSVAATLRSNTHTFVVGGLCGMAALAEVNAARVLITPALLAIPPFSQVFLPRLAARRGDGPKAVLRVAVLSTAALVAIALSYCAALLLASPWLLPLALGRGYAAAGALLPAWCAIAVLMAARNCLANVMQAMREFRRLMLLQLAITALSLGLAAWLCSGLGGIGALLGLCGAELLLCLLLLRLLFAAAAGDPRPALPVAPFESPATAPH